MKILAHILIAVIVLLSCEKEETDNEVCCSENAESYIDYDCEGL
tara:strand:- start:499 stop:630 length:132 start_codon:yes stop_codon:yes gene_type:complete